MNSLTTTYHRPQLRLLPVPGGNAPVRWCYAVRVPGGWELVNHSFCEWAVGDFIQKATEQEQVSEVHNEPLDCH